MKLTLCIKAVTGWSVFMIGFDFGRSRVLSDLFDSRKELQYIILSPTRLHFLVRKNMTIQQNVRILCT